MKNNLKLLAIAALFLVPISIFLVFRNGKVEINKLPIFGEKIYDAEKKDTIYQTIPDFSFIDQDGETITNKTFDSGIYIANFFFSTCKDVCPRMNNNVMNLYEKFLSRPMVKYLTHTVDPENDTVETLNKFTSVMRIKSDKWHFVTGEKKDIYAIAMKGYLLPTGEDASVPADSVKFFHSSFLTLVDSHHRIRGFYDGLSMKDIKKLDDEIKVLLYETVHEKGEK